ncbi:MAG: septum formation inhibitor Maf [Bdellovibrionales bacterium]|nr:septum formation inhibitor Maf [Bdellovibrionales bacterium]
MYSVRKGLHLVLASQSPRRSEILSSLGFQFDVVPSEIDEGDKRGDESPKEYVLRLALEKAVVVANRFPDSIVLGADTTVSLGEKVLGKPQNVEEAEVMLRQLEGNAHQVLGGLAVVSSQGGTLWHEASVTEVRFRKLTSQEIQAYIATGEPFDKAGAYGIQGVAGSFVRYISGSYSNVVGLDSRELITALLELNLIEVVS